jgi:hypothetical protein
VIFGYSNKAHDGFLGNSVIGEWCNLGADTNNSNLKNNYGEVKVFGYEEQNGEVDGTDEEDITKMAPTEATLRFYFELTYELSNRDITKIEQIENTNLYLCLNTASLMKDRIIKERNELKKLENQNKTR